MPESLKAKTLQASSPQAQGWYDSWKAATQKGTQWDNSGWGGVPINKAPQADQLRAQQLTQEGIAKGYMPAFKDGGMWGGFKDAFLNPAVLSAVGMYGLQSAGAFGSGASTGASFGGMGTGGMSTAGGGVASTGSGVATGIGSGGGFGGGTVGAGAAGAGAAAGGASAGGTLATLGKYSGLIGSGLSTIGSLYGAKMNADAMDRQPMRRPLRPTDLNSRGSVL